MTFNVSQFLFEYCWLFKKSQATTWDVTNNFVVNNGISTTVPSTGEFSGAMNPLQKIFTAGGFRPFRLTYLGKWWEFVKGCFFVESFQNAVSQNFGTPWKYQKNRKYLRYMIFKHHHFFRGRVIYIPTFLPFSTHHSHWKKTHQTQATEAMVSSRSLANSKAFNFSACRPCQLCWRPVWYNSSCGRLCRTLGFQLNYKLPGAFGSKQNGTFFFFEEYVCVWKMMEPCEVMFF